MKKFIKIISLLLAMITAVACFASCNGDVATESKNDDVPAPEPAAPDAKFGIILQIENGAFTDMRDGIKAALVEAGYSEKNIDVKCAQGDMTALSTIAQSMDDGSYTAVFTIATAATQTFVNLESDTPCFFCAVSDPKAAKVVTDFASPDKNATGTSNAIPVSDIFALADKLTPGITKYGIIYCTSQTNAVSTGTAAKEYLDSQNIENIVKTISDASEVNTATQALIEAGVEAIFVPNDQIVQSAITGLTEACLENKIPTYCSSATTVQSGCFATIAIDDVQIGKKTVNMALEYLKNGKKMSEIPTVVVDIDYCSVNKNVMEALGVTVPEDLGYELKVVE